MSQRRQNAPKNGKNVFHDFIHTLFLLVRETARAHPLWIFPIAAAIAFSESFVGISFVIPGTVLLITLGGVIGASHIPLFPAWLGAVLGHHTRSLGVEHFGQTGSLAELYRHYGIDADGIVAAVEAIAPGRPVRHLRSL